MPGSGSDGKPNLFSYLQGLVKNPDAKSARLKASRQSCFQKAFRQGKFCDAASGATVDNLLPA
jgi:hypothetical protein